MSAEALSLPFPEPAGPSVVIHHGDCLDVLRSMADASVDAVVTDPPYELGFMGRKWDASGIAYSVDLWREVLRVLKPGGHLLAFGGTRTYHRMTCAIEDAGFEIRDTIAWMYGQGFPKSARVNRDPAFCQCAAAGHSDESTSHEPATEGRRGTEEALGDDARAPEGALRSTSEFPDSLAGCHSADDSGGGPPHQEKVGAQASLPSRGCAPERTHSSALVDATACEPERSLSPARRTCPPSSRGSSPQLSSQTDTSGRSQESTSRAGISVSARHTPGIVREASSSKYAHGFPHCKACGRPNVDGFGTALKPAFEPVTVARKPLVGTVAANVQAYGTGAINVDGCRVGTGADKGIWPVTSRRHADVAFTLAPTPTNSDAGRWPANVVLDEDAAAVLDARFGDSGGASRFFYCAKAARAERNAGCEALPKVLAQRYGDQAQGPLPQQTPRREVAQRNHHPTVKPVALMRWLVRLVTPPGGVVLDPFAGSGTTLVAAKAEGFHAVGIEREAEYVEIIKARVGA